MSRPDMLPRAVETVVTDYLRRLGAERLPTLHDLYLVGSVALDDFRPGASDIDFVAVVEADLSEEACEGLARVYAGLNEAGGPLLDGPYLTVEALRRLPTDYASAPFSLEGRFRRGEVCREVNPAVWRCLALHGRMVLGPPPAELGIADDGEVLRAYQVDNLRTYWSRWIEQAETALSAKAPGEDANATALAWGVLGVARIVCAFGDGPGRLEVRRGAARAGPASGPLASGHPRGAGGARRRDGTRAGRDRPGRALLHARGHRDRDRSDHDLRRPHLRRMASACPARSFEPATGPS